MTDSPAGPAVVDDPLAHYHSRGEKIAGEASQLQRRQRVLVHLRGVTFLAAGTLAVAGFANPEVAAFAYASAGLLAAAFLYFCYVFEQAERRRLELSRLELVSRRGAARIERDWEALPLPVSASRDDTVEESLDEVAACTAGDLDLYGHASLMQLTSRAHTPHGLAALRRWLARAADTAEVRRRQAAVAELAPQWELREALELDALAVAQGGATPAALIHWAERDDAPPARLAWLRAARWIPLLVFGPLILLGTPAAAWAGGLFGFGVGVGFLVSLAVAAKTAEIFQNVATSQDEVSRYADLFERLAEAPVSAPLLAELRGQLDDPQHGPVAQLRRLRRITRLAVQRSAGLIQAILYLLAQVLLVADVHLQLALESWRRDNRRRVRGWFEQLGDYEALASLAGVSFDHPQWPFPEIADDSRELSAEQVGHPLLHARARVCNDVTLGPPGTFLLVTGSNMSGKSTLLRAVGVNAALAQAGGVVCARRWRSPPLRLATSMRIHDSLNAGVSFFMAELQRLKKIVDQAAEHRDSGLRLLFLLDEILQGTNSAERQIAVTRVIRHLVRCGAIGAVTTHDLELAEIPDLAAACRTVHFRETIHPDGKQMTFDYQLRQGVAPTTNALKLLQLVGLDLQDD